MNSEAAEPGIARHAATTERRHAVAHVGVDDAYRQLFESNPQPMSILDSETLRFLVVNDAAVGLYGHDRKELLKLCLRDVVEPGQPLERDELLARLPVSLEQGPELRHIGRDGTVADVRMALHQIDFEGRAAICALMSDVSEARRQRDEQAAQNMRLARSITETHHRVKNHLQLISAVVELQIDDQEMVPTSALKRIGHHARSLAALHDLLTNESKVTMRTDSISTRAAFDKLIALMQIGVVGRAICCDVDDFRLPVREGASVALLVSELVSNAIKHGCGDIHVGLHADDECVRLVVADDGPGFPQEFDWRSAANTGLGIIESTGRYDLRGAVHYENREEGGGRVTITFPMPAPRPV